MGDRNYNTGWHGGYWNLDRSAQFVAKHSSWLKRHGYYDKYDTGQVTSGQGGNPIYDWKVNKERMGGLLKSKFGETSDEYKNWTSHWDVAEGRLKAEDRTYWRGGKEYKPRGTKGWEKNWMVSVDANEEGVATYYDYEDLPDGGRRKIARLDAGFALRHGSLANPKSKWAYKSARSYASALQQGRQSPDQGEKSDVAHGHATGATPTEQSADKPQVQTETDQSAGQRHGGGGDLTIGKRKTLGAPGSQKKGTSLGVAY